jgi:hypothetical protein
MARSSGSTVVRLGKKLHVLSWWRNCDSLTVIVKELGALLALDDGIMMNHSQLLCRVFLTCQSLIRKYLAISADLEKVKQGDVRPTAARSTRR